MAGHEPPQSRHSRPASGVARAGSRRGTGRDSDRADVVIRIRASTGNDCIGATPLPRARPMRYAQQAQTPTNMTQGNIQTITTKTGSGDEHTSRNHRPCTFSKPPRRWLPRGNCRAVAGSRTGIHLAEAKGRLSCHPRSARSATVQTRLYTRKTASSRSANGKLRLGNLRDRR